MEDERDALAAIFEDDFLELVDSASGCPLWRFRLVEHNVAVSVKLPKGYPETDAPEVSFEFDQWPVGWDAFVERLMPELREQWTPGEPCAFAWIEHVKEALQSRCVQHEDGDDAGAVTHPVEAVPVRTVPLDAAIEGQVTESLLRAGFQSFGPSLYSHGDRGVTVEAGADLSITVDGIDAENLVDWTSMQLSVDAANFGSRLLDWVNAERSAEPGFLEDGDSPTNEGLDFLPSAQEMGTNRDRPLHIYTWGKALRKAAPPDSECNFNAGILNGRGGGADLRTMNGLSDEVQSNVASCGLFPRWISMVCAKVEHSDLHTISINCTKGRHRSVAAAEILRKLYYPSATMKHLTIY